MVAKKREILPELPPLPLPKMECYSGKTTTRWPLTPKVLCICQRCGKEHLVHQSTIDRGGGKYCSRSCYRKGTEKVEIKCFQCGKTVMKHQCSLKRVSRVGDFCSRDCYYIWGKTNWWTEEKRQEMSDRLNKWFENPENRKAMNHWEGRHHTGETRKLLREKRMGELNPFFGKHHTQEVKDIVRASSWRGGLSDLQDLIRKNKRYIDWRNAVYKRDNYCDWLSGVNCGATINAHHMIPLKRLIEENNIKSIQEALDCEALWDINNGVTMLESSHKAYHNMWGR